jgi:hypothetical protein
MVWLNEGLWDAWRGRGKTKTIMMDRDTNSNHPKQARGKFHTRSGRMRQRDEQRLDIGRFRVANDLATNQTGARRVIQMNAQQLRCGEKPHAWVEHKRHT